MISRQLISLCRLTAYARCPMAQILVGNIEEDIKARLKQSAT